VFGAGYRETHATLAMLRDDMHRWQRELIAERGTEGSPFAADAECHVVSICLRDVDDPAARRARLQVPTAFMIDAGQGNTWSRPSARRCAARRNCSGCARSYTGGRLNLASCTPPICTANKSPTKCRPYVDDFDAAPFYAATVAHAAIRSTHPPLEHP